MIESTSHLFELGEDATAGAWRDIAAAGGGPDLLQSQDVAGALALTSPGGGLLFNRAFGASASSIPALAEHYRRAGIGQFFIHLAQPSQADHEVARSAGLGRYPRAWIRLGSDLGDVPIYSTDLELGRARAGERSAIAELFCRAFDVGPALEPVIAALVGRASWEVLVARERGRVVAVGLLYLHGEIGYLAGGATAPRYRQRGAQLGLMLARMRLAREYGCTRMVTETGEAVPGDPQHSYRNMLRAGLRPIGRIENYALPGMSWAHGRARISG